MTNDIEVKRGCETHTARCLLCDIFASLSASRVYFLNDTQKEASFARDLAKIEKTAKGPREKGPCHFHLARGKYMVFYHSR